MQHRRLGRTDMTVSAISFGAWAIGGAWGDVDDKESLRALHAAIDAGVNFIDTADVYGDGRSERLVQLHCPHPKVYDMPEVFGILDELVATGKLRHYGVSVETVDEAFRATRHPHVASVQIIFNVFRQKPAESFFGAAKEHGIGILARVPLASGLLTGKLTRESAFAESDHRRFNREGQAFDRGETFSGVPYAIGLDAVEAMRPLVSAGTSLAQFALRWILMFDAVSCAIPGAKTEAQARDNAAASELPPLSEARMASVRAVYEQRIRPLVHASW